MCGGSGKIQFLPESCTNVSGYGDLLGMFVLFLEQSNEISACNVYVRYNWRIK